MRLLVCLALGLYACQADPTPPPSPPRTADSAHPVTPPTATASVTATAPPSSRPPRAPSSCPEDMALVTGSYCPAVSQPCVKRPKTRGGEARKQCQHYGKSRCLSKTRRSMKFCMDRYEWPNEVGALPRTLTSWPEARKMCAARSKRLCTIDEFNFACEGESMNPHVYGHKRDKSACNFDRKYIARTYNYKRWERCMNNPACRGEYERLDQRKPAGSMKRCVSEHGIYDLNGNVNEWVMRPKQTSPRRSGLKGGWWGPVRNRCRPMTTFHLEGDWGYEVGFRCCKDPAATLDR